MKKYTNEDTENYYDWDNALYRDVWDPNWSVHFGVFEEWEWYLDFIRGANRLNDIIIEKSGISKNSVVLDAWCWTGATAEYIYKKIWCYITWVDISWVRILEANERINEINKGRMKFLKMSLDDIDMDNDTFSNVISQSVLYHVHERKKAIKKIYNVLQKDWMFVFEDFVRPNKKISEQSQKYVYERLLYWTDFNHKNYQDFLEETWFIVIEAIDLSEQMKKSYNFLVKILENKIKNGDSAQKEWYEKLYQAYPKMVEAIERKDLWRSLFVCKK